jgi:hypothetical protein
MREAGIGRLWPMVTVPATPFLLLNFGLSSAGMGLYAY